LRIESVGECGVRWCKQNEIFDAVKYRTDRVEKLRELYSEYAPELTQSRVGKGDKRKRPIVEAIIGKDFTPFEMENFKEIMPQIEKYIISVTPAIIEEKAIEISKLSIDARLVALKELKQENSRLYCGVIGFNAVRRLY
tara:strand:+ start:319 stop:735 length:417 start_codon:yes stop_codon:yes gene_type:complete